MSNSPENKLKCRYCTYTTWKIYTNKKGETKSGWGKLHNHVESFHPAELEVMEELLKAFEENQ